MKREKVTPLQRLREKLAAELALEIIAERWTEARVCGLLPNPVDAELTEAQDAVKRAARRLTRTLKCHS